MLPLSSMRRLEMRLRDIMSNDKLIGLALTHLLETVKLDKERVCRW